MPVNDVDTSDPAAADAASAAGAAEGDGTHKRAYVRRIFSEIAPRYDLLNHLLSFNIDKSWRRRAIAGLDWRRVPDGVYLDLCAGTLDVAAMLARQPGFKGVVVGADFAEPMLRAGSAKSSRAVVAPVAADALDLPLPNDSVAGAIVAFGIRNVMDLDAALVEVLRVLSPGAKFVILEFTTPRLRVVRALYHFYFHRLLPRIGGLVSGHQTAYRYLPSSVAHFPSEEELGRRMLAAGYRGVQWQVLSLGIAAIHIGHKG